VNAYVDPVVSLDVDIVLAAHDAAIVVTAAKDRGLRVEEFEHSVNLSSPESDLRIQIQPTPATRSSLQVQNIRMPSVTR